MNEAIYRHLLARHAQTHAAWEAHLADLAEFERSVNRTIDAL